MSELAVATAPDHSGPGAAPLRAVVLGAGNIGTDLIHKMARSTRLDCVQVVGRNPDSVGLRKAERLGIPVSAHGIAALLENPASFDIVFDCTDAVANRGHWRALAALGKRLVNLTPGFSGTMIVPSVNRADAATSGDLNMVSCGGQAAIPLLAAVAPLADRIAYAEIVTTASTSSVGRGTRVNLDEYIDITVAATHRLVPISEVKCMLNLSPARPPAVFRVTIFVEAIGLRTDEVAAAVHDAVREVSGYCPGYSLTEVDLRKNGSLVLEVQVKGGTDSLPEFAGNLDLINSAAVSVGETMR
jgi:acetaldehyde dehydrogenase